jgi:hypothetical protein
MNRHLTAHAIVRSRWTAELATALEDAERVLAQLVVEGISSFDAEQLRLRLIALRPEVQRLNRVSLTEGRIVGPSWPVRINAA